MTDAYITVGTPDWTVVGTQTGRLSITPALHPNRLRIGAPFIGRVTFDGAPVGDLAITMNTEAQRVTKSGGSVVYTDADGVFMMPLATPGVAQLWARMQAPAPAGAETDIRSYTTAITVNVAVN